MHPDYSSLTYFGKLGRFFVRVQDNDRDRRSMYQLELIQPNFLITGLDDKILATPFLG
jgi:hypothetical protein